jgi:hypothetical protein
VGIDSLALTSWELLRRGVGGVVWALGVPVLSGGWAKQESTIRSFGTGGPWGMLAGGCGSMGLLLLSCWFREAPSRLPCPLPGWAWPSFPLH